MVRGESDVWSLLWQLFGWPGVFILAAIYLLFGWAAVGVVAVSLEGTLRSKTVARILALGAFFLWPLGLLALSAFGLVGGTAALWRVADSLVKKGV